MFNPHEPSFFEPSSKVMQLSRARALRGTAILNKPISLVITLTKTGVQKVVFNEQTRDQFLDDGGTIRKD